MFVIHLESVGPKDGVARATVKYQTDVSSGTDETATLGIEETENAIRELLRVRHLLKETKKHHIGNCDDCTLDAVSNVPG